MEKVSKVNGERLLYTLLFMVIGNISTMVIGFIVVVQFLFGWFGGGVNQKLLSFSASLAEYIKALVAYVTFCSDRKPWPISDWPSDKRIIT